MIRFGCILLCVGLVACDRPFDGNEDDPVPQIDVTGTWDGHVTGAGETLENPRFSYSLSLIQDGFQVGGMAQTRFLEDSTRFGTMRIEGTVDGFILRFEEVAIVDELPPEGLAWCLKFAALRFGEVDREHVLQGSYSDSGCNEGVIWVSRPIQ